MKLIMVNYGIGKRPGFCWAEDNAPLGPNEIVWPGMEMPAMTPYTVWDGSKLVEDTEKQAQEQLIREMKAADIAAALPDWATIKGKFDTADAAINQALTDLAKASTVAQLKAVIHAILLILQGMVDIMRKTVRVLYWIVKNSLD